MRASIAHRDPRRELDARATGVDREDRRGAEQDLAARVDALDPTLARPDGGDGGAEAQPIAGDVPPRPAQDASVFDEQRRCEQRDVTVVEGADERDAARGE